MAGEEIPAALPSRRRWRVRLTRDALIFTVGLVGIVHEAIGTSVERPTLLLLFAAMVGLPAFLRIDETRRGEDPAAGREETTTR